MNDFTVEIDKTGRVCLSGSAAIHVLLRLVLEAKFGTEPNADVLLSPHVETLVEAVAKAAAAQTPWVLETDWANPAILTPSAFVRAAEAVRRRHAYLRASHEAHPDAGLQTSDLEAMLVQAMKPYAIPTSRLTPFDPAEVTEDVLDRLEALDLAASHGPWFVRRLDDTLCNGALAVSTRPDTGANESMRAGDWPGGEVVAATLIQDPPYVVPADDRHEENTDLIAECRTRLSELIRLARIGLKAEQNADSDPAT